ncbi:uncharacterized protein LOC144706585 [Wolffia australiana]
MNSLDQELSVTRKRLAELLQEQQEPFWPDLDILESGKARRSISSEFSTLCWPGSGVLRSLRLQLDRRRRKRLIRSVIKTLHLRHPPQATELSTQPRRNSERDREEFSDRLKHIHGDSEKKTEWEGKEKKEERSPVSVLERLPDDDSPEHDDRGETKTEERSGSADFITLLEGISQSTQMTFLSEEEDNVTRSTGNPKNHHVQTCLGKRAEVEESVAFGRVMEDVRAEIGDSLLGNLLEELVSGLTPPTCFADSNIRICL